MASLRSDYYTIVSYLFRGFSILLMCFCVYFAVVYVLSFFSDQWGYYPPASLLLLVFMITGSVIAWKLSGFMLKEVGAGRAPFQRLLHRLGSKVSLPPEEKL